MTVALDDQPRLDKAFAVVVGSELYGESVAIVRFISSEGMLVRTNDILLIGTTVTVHFHIDDTDDEIVARAEVTGRPAIIENVVGVQPFGTRGMWLRFLDFDENLPISLPGTRVLH